MVLVPFTDLVLDDWRLAMDVVPPHAATMVNRARSLDTPSPLEGVLFT